MSGHRIIADLAASNNAYAGGLLANIITVDTGAPDGDTPGYVYIRTDGTDEDTRLYLRGDTTANDWNAVLGGT